MRYLYLIVILISFHSQSARAALPLKESQNFDSLKRELGYIWDRNLELRDQVIPTVKEFGFESPEMKSLDRKLATFDSTALNRVVEIIEEYGWLGKSEVGDIGSTTIFLVIQHARDPNVRILYFPLFERSAQQGESNLSDMAAMKDRILIEQGKEQLYGTQSRMVNGKLELFPVEDENWLNERRKEVGLKEIDANRK